MIDYILREAATQAKPEFLNENHDDAEKALYAKGWNACNIEYIDNLLDIPPADVRPVKRGRWEDRCTAGIEETVCSECLHGGFHHFNFCPNCGADMTGGADK